MKQQKPLLSIVIPTLNEQYYLPNLLHDITKQQEKNFEIIVVDADSEDNTRKVVYQYTQQIPVSFFSVRKRDLAYQRNAGARKAKGTYLIFLDADCRILPAFTKKLAAAITKKGGLYFLPTLVPDERSPKHQFIFTIINAAIEASQSIGKPIPSASATFIEKNLFHTLGGFDEHAFRTEDHELILRARKWGVIARFLRDVKVVFSLRRVRKEGELTLLTKMLISTTAMLMNGRLKEGIFEYEMGGHMFPPEYPTVQEKNIMQRFLQKATAFMEMN